MRKVGKDELCVFECAVLTALARIKNPVSRPALHADIETSLGHPVALRVLYAVLIKLETKGLIASWRNDVSAGTDLPRVAYFELESAGRRLLRTTQAIAGPLNRCA